MEKLTRQQLINLVGDDVVSALDAADCIETGNVFDAGVCRLYEFKSKIKTEAGEEISFVFYQTKDAMHVDHYTYLLE